MRKGCADLENHIHTHEHHHHKERKQVYNRLAKIEGHVRSVKQMTEDGRDCPDLLLQIAVIRKAQFTLNSFICRHYPCLQNILKTTTKRK